jgi:sarcosine oxidase, subunit beta
VTGYSFAALLRNALFGHRRWSGIWRSASLAPTYDAVIIGGGGHGLATAYYLARLHGMRKIAVLEKGWLGGGNSGRNTQVTRSNYFWPDSAAFYEYSLQLFEQLSQELNFNVMLSQRGVLSLAHSHHEMETMRRWANAIQLNGIDSEILTATQIKRLEPLINLDSRFPIYGGFIQKRAGISRHDAVNWGYARAASALGVDIVENCEVTGFRIRDDRIVGLTTNRGDVTTQSVCMAVAGHSSHLAAKAGLRLPLTSMSLQAMVSEPIKPVLNTVTMSAAIHMYVSQSDRGEVVLGGGADAYNSYAQRGGLPMLEQTVASFLELFPAFRRLRLLRQWAGTVDISPDTTPIMGLTPIAGLYLSAGWGTGGYKAIPAGGFAMAHTIAHGNAHPLIRAFSLDRFTSGRLINEGAAAGVAH